jgi:hypothetical protein
MISPFELVSNYSRIHDSFFSLLASDPVHFFFTY